MPRWQNWSGRLQSAPQQLHFIRSETDATAIALAASSAGTCIRVAGAAHSHAPLVQNDGIIVDTRGLSGLVSVDLAALTSWVRGGTRIYALGAALQEHGLALSNQGDIDEQAIAGATATGTHGTGAALSNLSSRVLGMRIVLASGEAVICDETQNTELLHAARLHLGAFGIITQLNLQLEHSYVLEEQSWTAPLQDTLDQIDELVQTNRHCEFFWYPQTDAANVKIIDRSDEDPTYPLGIEGHRRAWSHEVLPNYRPNKHTEMEYSIPMLEGPACMREIKRLIETQFTDVRWPVEYRTLAADDVWLSTAYQQDTVTISVHQDVREDEEAYYRACEEIFLSYGGKPHWGKVHYLTGAQLEQCHARWHDWWRVRNHFDPARTFLNPYLRSLQ